MKNNSGSLYLLQDGTHADPKDCSAGKDGVLRHKNGLAVAMREDGEPQTLGSDAVQNMNVEAAKIPAEVPLAAPVEAEPPAPVPIEPDQAEKPKASAKPAKT